MAVGLELVSEALVWVIVNEPGEVTHEQYRAVPAVALAMHSPGVSVFSCSNSGAATSEVWELVAVEGRRSGVASPDYAAEQAVAHKTAWVGIGGVAKGFGASLAEASRDWYSAAIVAAARW